MLHVLPAHEGPARILATRKGHGHLDKQASGLLHQSMEKLNECKTFQLSTRPPSPEMSSLTEHVWVIIQPIPIYFLLNKDQLFIF